ncbi:hypothetical protein [Ferruginibacter sp.]
MDAETTKAYLAGLKLKNSGLSEEIIYARLEKQGFPEELARRVARDVIRENEKESLKDSIHYGLIIAVMGFLVSVGSFFIFEDHIYIFPGLIIAGIGSAIWLLNKRKD